MQQKTFPVIDPVATGENIVRLRKERGMTVRDLQMWFGFEEPRAIYKWQQGQTLPTIDNLYALSALLDVPMEDILVGRSQVNSLISFERQDDSCRPAFFPAA
jgi:transcriptional regulator with XRE-family HTH domain